MGFGIDLASGKSEMAWTDVIDEAIVKVTITTRKQVLNGCISDPILFLFRVNSACVISKFRQIDKVVRVAWIARRIKRPGKSFIAFFK